MEDFFIKVDGREYKVRTTIDNENVTYEITIGAYPIIYSWDLEKDVLRQLQTTDGCNDHLLQTICTEIENHYFHSLNVIWVLI